VCERERERESERERERERESMYLHDVPPLSRLLCLAACGGLGWAANDPAAAAGVWSKFSTVRAIVIFNSKFSRALNSENFWATGHPVAVLVHGTILKSQVLSHFQ